MTKIIPNPSDEAKGEVADLLRFIEKKSPGAFATGVAPKSWEAGAKYANQWINMDGASYDDIGHEYDISSMTVKRRANSLFGMEAFQRFYGERLPVGGSLGELLSGRRASEASVSFAISESRNGVSTRLQALDRYDDSHELHSWERGGVEYYWTEFTDKV